MPGQTKATNLRAQLFTPTLTVLFTAFIAVTYGFGIYLFPVIMADMRDTLGFTYEQAGIATAGGQIGFLLAALVTSPLSNRYGGGWVVLASIGICAAGLFALYQVPDIWLAAVWLTITGGTAASAYIPMVEICQRYIDSRHRGKVLGLISSGTSYGVFINGLIVPVALASGGWRQAWLYVALGTTVLVVLSAIFLFATGLLRRPGADASARSQTASGGSRQAWIHRAMASINSQVLLIWALMFINGFACLSFQSYFASYLREELGFSATFSSSLWTLIGFVGMGGGLAMGALADWLTLRVSMGLSYIFIASASLLLLNPIDPALLYVAAITFALGFYAIFGLVPAYISQVTDTRRSTVVFGVGNILLGVGAMIGNYVGGFLRTATGTFEWTYILVIVGMVGAIVTTVALPCERRQFAPAE